MITHDPVQWRCKIRVDKHADDIDPYIQNLGKRFGEHTFFAENKPIESIEVDGNLLMTAGANALWTALIGTAGTFTNALAAIGVGDNVGPGTLAATNASTSITGTSTSFTTDLYVGQVINIAGTAYTIASITSATALTLTAAYSGTTASGLSYTANPIAAQTNLFAAVNAARVGMTSGYPAVTNNQVQFQATFGGSVANFTWNEWGTFNSVGTGSPPTGGTMLNRAVPSGGLGVKASGSTWTLTVTLSLS